MAKHTHHGEPALKSLCRQNSSAQKYTVHELLVSTLLHWPIRSLPYLVHSCRQSTITAST